MVSMMKCGVEYRFLQLCKLLVKTKGNPTAREFLNCGYSLEDFIYMFGNNANKEYLYQSALKNLIKWGYKI